MPSQQIIGTARKLLSDATSTARLVNAHRKDLARTSVEILRSARAVVVEGGRESVELFDRTRDELQRTLADGVDQLRYKLVHINTPTHREQAEAHKAEVKDKKRRKRADRAVTASAVH